MKKSPILPLLATAALAAGCASSHNPAGQQAQQALRQVRDQYMAGDYGDVIRTVATSDQFADAPQATLVEALKLQAFSYCLTRYTQLCEDDFVRILRMDPSFQLAPNEAGHPLWGPAFQHARQIVKGGAA
jgi:hypothetical protein